MTIDLEGEKCDLTCTLLSVSSYLAVLLVNNAFPHSNKAKEAYISIVFERLGPGYCPYCRVLGHRLS
jgi:hypothetical protein